MSFPKAKIKRFNDVDDSVPPVGSYDPKLSDKTVASSFEKTGRFPSCNDLSSSSTKSMQSFNRSILCSSAFKLPMSRTRSLSVAFDNGKVQELEKEIRRLLTERSIHLKDIATKDDEIKKLDCKMQATIREKNSLKASLATFEKENKELNRARDIYKAKVTAMESVDRRKDLSTEVVALTEQLLHKNHEIDDIRDELFSVKNELEECIVDLSVRDEELLRVRGEKDNETERVLSEKEEETERLRSEMNAMERVLREKDEEMERLLREMDAMEQLLSKKNNEMERVLSEKDEEVELLQSIKDEETERLQSEMDATKQLLSKKDNEMERVLSIKDEEMERLQSEKDEEMERLQSEKDEEMERLRSEMDAMEQLLSEKDEETERVLSKQNEEVERLRSIKDEEMVRLLREMDVMGQLLSKKNNEMERLQSEKDEEMERLRSEMSNKIRISEAERELVIGQLSELREMHQHLIDSHETLEDKLSELKEYICIEEEMVDELREQKEDLLSKLSDHQRQLELQQQQATQAYDELRQEHVALQDRIEEQANERRRAEVALSAELGHTYRQLEDCPRVLQECKNAFDEQVSTLRGTIAKLEDQQAADSVTIKNLDEKMCEITSRLSEKEQALLTSRSEVESLEEQMHNLQKLRSDYQKMGVSLLESEFIGCKPKEADRQEHDQMVQSCSSDIYGKLQELTRMSAYWQQLYEELHMKVEPFMEQLNAYEVDRMVLMSKNRETMHDYSKLSERYATLLGHQNHKQKIHYVTKMKEENLALKEENTKLWTEVLKYRKTMTRRGDTPGSASRPSKAFQQPNKENTPQKFGNTLIIRRISGSWGVID